MKTKLYNLSGKEVGEVELSEKIFGVAVKPEVVHEVYVAQMSRARENWAHTKNRGDVSGGGKKPWQQKGTGRARHGSIRSPIWRGGGVTFGPRSNRNYDVKINQKTRRLAIRMCLSDKLASGQLIMVEDLNFAEPKTKLFTAFIKSLPQKIKKALVLTNSKEQNAWLAARNLSTIGVLPAADVNVVSLLEKETVILNQSALAKLTQILS